MREIVVDVTLAATGGQYDVRLPESMNSLMAANLTARALSRLSDGSYLPSDSSIFAFRENGRLLDTSHALSEEKVHNGSRLLLI